MKSKTSLKKYQIKRDFNQTREPKGEIEKARNKSLNFVIQKHAARQLHYDFRLEYAGTLKSWAVPKGLPQPGEKHLAMMVEDHPLEYRNFEGVIPAGNYGAGTVMIWDKGKYHLKYAYKTFTESLKHGEITVILKGKKIRGEFSLVKFKKENNSWLLIRRKDSPHNRFRDDMSAKSGKTMKEIATGKNNLMLKNISGAARAKEPQFIRPMMATLTEKSFSKNCWLFEFKWDGYRTIAVKINKILNLYSRNRKKFNDRFSPIFESLQNIPGDFILDGEIVAIDSHGKTNFQMLQEFLIERKGTLIYYVFDILYLNGYDLKKVKLKDRKIILKKFLPNRRNVKLGEYIETEGKKLFQKVVKAGMEGIVAKNMSSDYQPGARGNDWLKIKATKSQEVVIAGFTQPRGSRKIFGSLVTGVYKNNELVYTGHVGGGFDEKDLDFLYAKFKPLIRKKSYFKNVPETNEPATWLKPELVAQVKFSEWTKEGLMRQPVFLGLREDKTAKDVRREKTRRR